MKKYTLQGQKRELVGRKVKNLRAKGVVPATVYGKKISSENVAINASEFLKLYASTGETGLIELSIGSQMSPVLVHTVQKHAVTGELLQVEFYHVDLKEKVHTKVPVVFIGEAAAVSEKKGVLLTLSTEVEVEALPAELPEKIEVDVTGLAEVDQELKVSDLKVPSGITILTDSEVIVVKVSELVSKAAEEQAAAEDAAAETATTEAAEAQAADKPAETATTEKSSEDKKE